MSIKCHEEDFVGFKIKNLDCVFGLTENKAQHTFVIKEALCLVKVFTLPVVSTVKGVQGCFASKRCSAYGLNCRYLNPYIKLKLTDMAIKLYQEF